VRAGGHAFQRAQNSSRARAAVDADAVGAPGGQASGGQLGVGAVEAQALFIHCDHGDSGCIRCGFMGGGERLLGFCERHDGLDQE
jgi:hypothetical protein